MILVQRRVAEEHRGACWLRLRRQAQTRLDGVDDAKINRFPQASCVGLPLVRAQQDSSQTSLSAPTAALRLRSLFALLLSASPVRIAGECPPSVRARLSGPVIGGHCGASDPSILVASELCSGTGGQRAAGYSILVSRTHGFEQAITAACSSALACLLVGNDRVPRYGDGSAAQCERHGMVLTDGGRVALRVAAANKEATLSAHTVSPGSRLGVVLVPWAGWRGAAGRATQAMSIIGRFHAPAGSISVLPPPCRIKAEAISRRPAPTTTGACSWAQRSEQPAGRVCVRV